MKHKLIKHSLIALAAVLFVAHAVTAADLTGNVQGAGKPIAGSTVTLYAASTGAPTKLVQGKTDDQGAFKLTYGDAPADSVLYVIAKSGTPKAAADKGPNDAIALLAVLGGTPPKNFVVNEFSSVASVWTSAQFLKGEMLSGTKLGLRIAAGNVPHFVNLETGSYGDTIADGLNSTQTPTLANFCTLANLLAGCIKQVTPDACNRFFAAATDPYGKVPTDTLTAAEMIAQNPWHNPKMIFSLLNEFYPVPQGKFMRPTPFMPYLSFAPSAWVLPLKFTGGGLSGVGKIMFDSQGNAWLADNFQAGAQSHSILWSGTLSKFSPNGKPLSPPIVGYTGGGLLGPGFGLTLDAQDNVWVTSVQSQTISKFDNAGKPLSPPDGYNLGGKLGKMQGIIAAPNGDIWALDTTGNQVVRFPKGDVTKGELLLQNPTSDPLKNPYKLLAPFHLAIDQQDRIWVSNIGGDWVTRFDANNPTKVETFKTGFSGSGVTIDSQGNVWITNRYGSSERGRLSLIEMMAAYKFDVGGDHDAADRMTKSMVKTMVAQKPGYWEGGSVTVLRPDGSAAECAPIYGKGIAGPWAATVDGNDHVWVSNLTTESAGIVELAGFQTDKNPPGKKPGDAISPPGGYVGGGLQLQVDIAISPSGDVWVGNNWQDWQEEFEEVSEAHSTRGGGQGVVVFFGMAKPVRTPQIGTPRPPAKDQRP